MHRTIEPLKRLTGSGKSEKKLAELDLADVAAWACQIALATAQAWPKVKERLDQEGQDTLLAELSLPMSRLLAEMQLCGIWVDKDDLEKMGDEFGARKSEVEESIYELAGSRFNIGSTKQLAAAAQQHGMRPTWKDGLIKAQSGQTTLEEVAAVAALADAYAETAELKMSA